MATASKVSTEEKSSLKERVGLWPSRKSETMIEKGTTRTQSTKAVRAEGGKLGLSSNEFPHP